MKCYPLLVAIAVALASCGSAPSWVMNQSQALCKDHSGPSAAHHLLGDWWVVCNDGSKFQLRSVWTD